MEGKERKHCTPVSEKKQFLHPDIKNWLDELKDAIYDAEDLLNQISYDSMRCKVTSQVLNFLSSLFNTNADINSQIEKAYERLQLFAQHIETIGLQTVSHRVLRTTRTSLLVDDDSVVVGRYDDKCQIKEMLLSDTDNKNTGVVAILGMGGLGKTTLAKLVYNDREVRDHFDLRAWAYVSKIFDILKVTKLSLKLSLQENGMTIILIFSKLN